MTENATTSQPTTAAPTSPTLVPPPAPRLLLRRRPRWLGGVAAGLAAYTGVPVALLRVLFVVVAFMGPGILLYPVLWVVVPDADRVSAAGPSPRSAA